MGINKQNDDVMLIEDSINEYDKYMTVASNKSKKRKGAKFFTELECFNELGESIWKDHNELLLSGGLFTLSKISGVNAPINIKTLNQDLSILASETNPGFTGPRREDVIVGFVIGTSGSGDTFDTVKKVEYKERTITSLVPFRTVEQTADLSSAERAKYKLKKANGIYYDYFLKLFETTPQIKVEYDEPGSPSVPANVDETTDNKVINTYLQYVLKINANDVREFFKIRGGGLRKARVNTLALVHGYLDGSGEYKGGRCFSKINFNNEPFDNETKELTVVYKIYI